MKELKADIKNGSFRRAYLLFGDERYLAEQYAKTLKNTLTDPAAAQMNAEVFAGRACSVDAAIEAAETAAFMSGFRVVMLNDSGLFTSGRKADSEKLTAFLPEIPDTTVMLFLETDVDKRGRLYKKTAELGRAVEFKRPTEKELTGWLAKLLAKEGKRISERAAQAVLRTASGEMQLLYNEAQKLAAYASGDTIDEADVEAVCVKSLETRIFELVDAVGGKDARRALDIFNNMLLMKESPIMVLTMIARQLRLILQCLSLSGADGRAAPDTISARLGLRPFVVRDCLRQSRNFTADGLIAALKAALEADYGIKTGRVGDKIAVEMLIISLAGE